MRDYAKYCLQKWAEWANDVNGYPSRSNIAKFQEIPAHRAESSLPSGIEPKNREAEIAILILNMMGDSCPQSQKSADIIKRVNRGMSDGESVKEAIERLGIQCNQVDYSNAVREFTVRLETLLYRKS